jgi:hypothetical protein
MLYKIRKLNMQNKELVELVKKLPLLIDHSLNISLRVTYFRNIYSNGKNEICFDYYDAYTGVVEILVYDLIHFIGALCAESNQKALGLKNIMSLWDKSIIVLETYWTNNMFPLCNNISKGEILKNRNCSEFNNRKNSITEKFREIKKSTIYRDIQKARNEVTAHREILNNILNNNSTMKLSELTDCNIKIDDVIKLWDSIFELIKMLYEIVTGCEYYYRSIYERQVTIACKFAELIPCDKDLQTESVPDFV